MITNNYSAKYARLRNNVVELSETPLNLSYYDCYLENVRIELFENGNIKIYGDEVIFNLTFEMKPLKEIEKEVSEKYIKYGYLSVIDFLKGIKKPYVSGWYSYKERTPYQAIWSDFKLILNNGE